METLEELFDAVIDFSKIYGGVYYLSSYADGWPDRWSDLVTYNSTDREFMTPTWFQGEDLYYRSNRRVFTSEYGDLPMVGDLGDGVVISLDFDDWEKIEEDEDPEASLQLTKYMVEALQSLADYPLLSEDDHSELQAEEESEAWESWAESDYKTALENQYHIELDDCDLMEVALSVMDDTGNYFHPDGDSVYLDVGQLAQNTELDRLLEAYSRCMLVCRWCGGQESEDSCPGDPVVAAQYEEDELAYNMADKEEIQLIVSSWPKVLGPRLVVPVENHFAVWLNDEMFIVVHVPTGTPLFNNRRLSSAMAAINYLANNGVWNDDLSNVDYKVYDAAKATSRHLDAVPSNIRRNDMTIRALEREAALGDPAARIQLAVLRGDEMIPPDALEMM